LVAAEVSRKELSEQVRVAAEKLQAAMAKVAASEEQVVRLQMAAVAGKEADVQVQELSQNLAKVIDGWLVGD
jgi:hypothetical protein